MHYIEYQNISAILRSDYKEYFCIFGDVQNPKN